MKNTRSIIASLVALAFAAGAAACDPGSDRPESTATSGAEDTKPETRHQDDDEGLIDDQQFGAEGLVDDEEGLVDDDEGVVDDEEGIVPDDTFGSEGIIDDDP